MRRYSSRLSNTKPESTRKPAWRRRGVRRWSSVSPSWYLAASKVIPRQTTGFWIVRNPACGRLSGPSANTLSNTPLFDRYPGTSGLLLYGDGR